MPSALEVNKVYQITELVSAERWRSRQNYFARDSLNEKTQIGQTARKIDLGDDFFNRSL